MMNHKKSQALGFVILKRYKTQGNALCPGPDLINNRYSVRW